MQNHKEAIFTNRIINQWNVLPQEVINGTTVNTFFQEQTGQDVERCGREQLRSYLAHQLQVQVQVSTIGLQAALIV